MTLLAQSGGRCMAPDCGVGVDDPDAGLLEIAAIHSDKAGGPRATQASGLDLTSPDNFLVLCANHHRMVDSNPSKFDAHVLMSWRSSALRSVAAQMVEIADQSVPELNLDEALETWERERGNSDEEFWQTFFHTRPKLLLALAYGVGTDLTPKCYVGGKDITNRGGGVVDFIVNERGNATLVEIKSPTTRLIGSNYRDGVWSPSQDLTGACVQALHYRSNLLHNLYSLAAGDSSIDAPDPQCVVLIGDLEASNVTEAQRRSLALFRRAIPAVTVLAYDELFERLRLSSRMLRSVSPD